MNARRRVKTRPESPSIAFACGCKTAGSNYWGIYCEMAVRLWDKVNAANHNLTVTRKVVSNWPVTTFHSFGPRRINMRESIYEYRRAQWNAHFTAGLAGKE